MHRFKFFALHTLDGCYIFTTKYFHVCAMTLSAGIFGVEIIVVSDDLDLHLVEVIQPVVYINHHTYPISGYLILSILIGARLAPSQAYRSASIR